MDPKRPTDPTLLLEFDIYSAQLSYQANSLRALLSLLRELSVKVETFENWSARADCPMAFQTGHHRVGAEEVTDDVWWSHYRLHMAEDIEAFRGLIWQYRERVTALQHR